MLSVADLLKDLLKVNKVADLLKGHTYFKQTKTGVFTNIFKNSFFIKHFRWQFLSVQ